MSEDIYTEDDLYLILVYKQLIFPVELSIPETINAFKEIKAESKQQSLSNDYMSEFKGIFNEELIKKRMDELVAMERGFNIAKEGNYKTWEDFQKSQTETWQQSLSKKDWEIYGHTIGGHIGAVKRLSDGEVFSVGQTKK